MTDPIAFDAATPRFSLPLLFAGQAQKEAWVNEAHALADALLHPAIEGEAAVPPDSPDEGTAWLVGATPGGAWTGQAGRLAFRQAGNWLFASPRDGMEVLNRSTGQRLLYRGGWQAPSVPPSPVGGTTVDQNARAAIAQIVQILRTAGILPAN